MKEVRGADGKMMGMVLPAVRLLELPRVARVHRELAGPVGVPEPLRVERALEELASEAISNRARHGEERLAEPVHRHEGIRVLARGPVKAEVADASPVPARGPNDIVDGEARGEQTGRAAP